MGPEEEVQLVDLLRFNVHAVYSNFTGATVSQAPRKPNELVLAKVPHLVADRFTELVYEHCG